MVRVFLAGQLRPYRKGAGPKRNPIFVVPSIYVYTIWRRTTKFDVVIHVGGGGRVSWGHPRLPSQESFNEPQFWGSPMFMPTPFKAERPNSAW